MNKDILFGILLIGNAVGVTLNVFVVDKPFNASCAAFASLVIGLMIGYRVWR